MDVIKNNGESAGGNKYLKYKFALVIIATAFFLYLSWYAYNTQVDTDVDPKKLPLIEFSRQIKFKPGDPGGIEIANLDKGIYDYISGRKVSKKVVISNHKEDPVSREEMIRILGNKTVKETPVKTNSVQSTSNVSQQKSPVLAVQPKKSVKKVQLYTKKMYYIRIAKLKNADVQSRAWEILKKKHSDILSGLNGSLAKERKSDKTSYYLHAGPVRSKADAALLCRKLISKGNACKIQSVTKNH